MTPFPIVPIPDPNDDGFDEPVCECGGSGMCVKRYFGMRYLVLCDCQPEEEED